MSRYSSSPPGLASGDQTGMRSGFGDCEVAEILHHHLIAGIRDVFQPIARHFSVQWDNDVHSAVINPTIPTAKRPAFTCEEKVETVGAVGDYVKHRFLREKRAALGEAVLPNFSRGLGIVDLTVNNLLHVRLPVH